MAQKPLIVNQVVEDQTREYDGIYVPFWEGSYVLIGVAAPDGEVRQERWDKELPTDFELPFDPAFGPIPPGRLVFSRFFDFAFVGVVGKRGHFGHLGSLDRLVHIERVTRVQEIERPDWL